MTDVNVLAPDGRRYVVQVVRLDRDMDESRIAQGLNALLPDLISIPLSIVTAVFTPRVRKYWGVRVFRKRRRIGTRSLLYGMEFNDFAETMERARKAAHDLIAEDTP